MFMSNFFRFLIVVTSICWSESNKAGSKRSQTVKQRELSVRGNTGVVGVSTISIQSTLENVTMTPTISTVRPTRPFQILHPKPDNVSIECIALRSKRYISDGFCTSIKPVSDVVCTGTCLPIRDLPWYAEFIKVWSRQKTLQYRCVDDLVRLKKVTFLCQNGETRTYEIRVVRSCKCKRLIRNQNVSTLPKKSKN